MERMPAAPNGRIVVAQLGARLTVGRYSRQGARAVLRFDNPAYPPLRAPARALRVLGIVEDVTDAWSAGVAERAAYAFQGECLSA